MQRNRNVLMIVTAVAMLASACQSANQRGAPTAPIEGLITSEAPGIANEPGSGDSGESGLTGSSRATSDGTPGASDSEGSPSGTSSTSGSGASGSGSSGSPGSGGSTTAGGGTSPGGGTTPGGSSNNQNLEMGPGVTAETITIGFQAGEVGAGFAAVGAVSEPAYENEMARALVDWLNATGGIRGREVIGAYHETETSQGTFAAHSQQACAALIDDAGSFAVISSAVGGNDSMVACTHEKGVPLFELNTWLWDQPYFDEYPNLYRPGHLRAEDGYRAYVEGLDDLGYFEGAKVGVLKFDDPVHNRMMDDVVGPALGRAGVTDYVVQEIGSPQGLSDFGAAGAQMGAAVLRFKSENVTHVLMVENAGIMPFFFLKEAESQEFRPIYGFSSIDIPQTQARQGDPNQLAGSLAVGWAPPIDFYEEDIADADRTAAYNLCRQILTDGGVENLAGFYAQSRCDAVFLLRAALEAAPALTADGLRAGVASLGETHDSGFTINASYGPAKRWGANTVRPLAYDNGCECYLPIGQRKRVA